MEKSFECDDAVSREAFIKRYDEWMYSEYGKHCEKDALAIRVANSLPPVTQKSGKWKREEFPNFTVAWFCNKCGRGSYHKSNYCPNCGARMVEPQESEDRE